jgi:hypothetical protein
MLFLSLTEAEICCEHFVYESRYILPVWRPPSWNSYFHLHCTVSTIAPVSSWTPKMWDSRWNFVPMCHRTWDNVLYVIYELRYICHRFCGRPLGSQGGNIVAKNMPFCSQNIFRKSHQSVPLKSERFRNGSEKIGLGGNFTPPPLVKEGLMLPCHRTVGSRLFPSLENTVGSGALPRFCLKFIVNCASIFAHLGVNKNIVYCSVLWEDNVYNHCLKA